MPLKVRHQINMYIYVNICRKNYDTSVICRDLMCIMLLPVPMVIYSRSCRACGGRSEC